MVLSSVVVEKLQRDKALIQRGARPQLSLDVEVAALDPHTETDARVGLSLALPLGGLWDAKLRAASALVDVQKRQSQYQQDILIGNVDAAYQRVVAARAKLATLQQQVFPDTAHTAEISLLAYKEGAAPMMTAVLAQRDLIDVRLAVLDAQIDAALAEVELNNATGGALVRSDQRTLGIAQ
jgi:outer membrane protein TolC